MWRFGKQLEIIGNEFRANGRVLISNALPDLAASRLRSSIDDLTERKLWYQAIHGDGRFLDSDNIKNPAHFSYRMDKFPVANIQLPQLLGGALGDSRRKSYQGVLPIGKVPERELPEDHPIRDFGRLINSRDTASLMSCIAGFPLPSNGANCFLSRFMAGDYLASHDDGLTEGGGRRIAFVYSLTKHWLPHWGGHTVFLPQREGSLAETVLPTFNSLLLFSVPVPHLVTAVAGNCFQARYSFTGWFHANEFTIFD